MNKCKGDPKIEAIFFCVDSPPKKKGKKAKLKARINHLNQQLLRAHESNRELEQENDYLRLRKIELKHGERLSLTVEGNEYIVYTEDMMYQGETAHSPSCSPDRRVKVEFRVESMVDTDE